jgi:hypothetical protein
MRLRKSVSLESEDRIDARLLQSKGSNEDGGGQEATESEPGLGRGVGEGRLSQANRVGRSRNGH